MDTAVFVPFLGDFLSISVGNSTVFVNDGFRPLSWGLSFNGNKEENKMKVSLTFSSPFLGTFFQLEKDGAILYTAKVVFVPFLGDFLSMIKVFANYIWNT